MAAPGRRTTLALGIVAGLLTIAISAANESVFNTDELVPTFLELNSHGCLPPDFDSSHTGEVAQKCYEKVTANESSITDCGSAPVVALFYNCLSNSLGETNAEGTVFNYTTVDADIGGYTYHTNWTNKAKEVLASCIRASAAYLKPRQRAVFTYNCWKWSMFSDCDNEQERRGALSDAALLRRAHFLSGSCPLNPIQLLDAFGVVTGRTWAECSTPLDTGADAQQKYDAEVSRVVCLLQNFTTAAGNIDFPRLNESILNGDGGVYDIATKHLQKIVRKCKRKQVATLEELVKCWASKGMYSCIYVEANQVARMLPQTCAIFV